MDISRYGIFCEVVKNGNITRTAESLGYSQSWTIGSGGSAGHIARYGATSIEKGRIAAKRRPFGR